MKHEDNVLRQLMDAVVRTQAEREIDTCMLAALLKLHPDPSAVRTSWQDVSAAMTTNRVLRAAAAETQSGAQALASHAAQARTRFWEQVLDGLAPGRTS